MPGCASRVVPQQWLARTSAPHVDPADRRRLDFVVYGATPLGEALCCDVTLVAPLTREGRPQPSAASRDGAAITVAERRKRAAYPELLRPGPQRLCVLACEVGGRWSSESLRLVTQLVRLRAQRAPAALRPAATQGWLRRWWGFLSVALQSTLLLPRCSERRTSLAHCLVPSSRRSRTYCTTQSLPPQAASARSAPVARDPDFLSCRCQKGALKKKIKLHGLQTSIHKTANETSLLFLSAIGLPPLPPRYHAPLPPPSPLHPLRGK